MKGKLPRGTRGKRGQRLGGGGLREVSRGWTTRGAEGLWGFLLSGVDAGELRTGEGRSVLSHPFSPCPSEQVPNLNSSR